MAERDRTLLLPDGRQLGYAEWGDPDGRPVLYFHGTPASRLDPMCFPHAPAAAGVRLLSIDRPGIGLSSFQPRRRIVDWPADVTAFADATGLERFGVVGWSGGGPYVLACAAALGDRLTGAVAVAGVGRLSRPGAARGLSSIDRRSYRLSRAAPPLARMWLAALFAASRRKPEAAFQGFLSDVSEPDRRVIDGLSDEAKQMGWFIEAGRQGGRGVTHEYRALTNWGFSLEDVRVAVELWQGDADELVPMDHAEDLAAAAPGAKLHRCPDEGHLIMVSHAEEMLSNAADSKEPARHDGLP